MNWDRRRRPQAGRVSAGGIVLGVVIVTGLALLATTLRLSAQQTRKADQGQQTAASRPAGSQPTPRNDPAALRWPRPRTSERRAERNRMVDQQIARDAFFRNPVRDVDVLRAMRAVPRHTFVPPGRRGSAYADTPLPIGHGQTISQPYIVALMTEQLRLKPGEKVLEIGTGSGYQAAVLSELTPHVFTIEIVRPLYEQVVERFEKLGYPTIQTRQADGYDGWPAHAPFDAIIVTCAAGHVPPPLWQQLKPGGRMVIPIGGVHEVQRLVMLTKQADGSRKSESILPVRFVPMIGKAQGDD